VPIRHVVKKLLFVLLAQERKQRNRLTIFELLLSVPSQLWSFLLPLLALLQQCLRLLVHGSAHMQDMRDVTHA